MTLKPLTETERLYHEMLGIYRKLGVVLRDYEAAAEKENPRPKKIVPIIDPYTGKPFRHRSKKKRKPSLPVPGGNEGFPEKG